MKLFWFLLTLILNFCNGKKIHLVEVLSVLARLGKTNYSFVNVYVPTNPSERKRFLILLETISLKSVNFGRRFLLY